MIPLVTKIAPLVIEMARLVIEIVPLVTKMARLVIKIVPLVTKTAPLVIEMVRMGIDALFVAIRADPATGAVGRRLLETGGVHRDRNPHNSRLKKTSKLRNLRHSLSGETSTG